MYRSLLFVPADDDKRVAHVHERGADGVILDLEDAVAPEAKDKARAGVRATAEALGAKGAVVFVRINAPWRTALADLDAVLGPAVTGVIAPKVRDAAQARTMGEMLRECEAAHGVDAGATQLIALIESVAGVHNAMAIAGVANVSGLALGSEDFCAEVGVAPGGGVLDLPCKLLALAAASRGLMALGVPISIGAFRDTDAYRAAIAQARAIGMNGALCIHPAQVEIANAGFTPGVTELAQARAIVAAFMTAQAAGRAVTSLDGRMIDAPVVAQARRVIAQGSH